MRKHTLATACCSCFMHDHRRGCAAIRLLPGFHRSGERPSLPRSPSKDARSGVKRADWFVRDAAGDHEVWVRAAPRNVARIA